MLEIKDRGKERLHSQLRTVLRRVMTLKEMHSEIIANQLQNELNQELAAIKMQLVTLNRITSYNVCYTKLLRYWSKQAFS